MLNRLETLPREARDTLFLLVVMTLLMIQLKSFRRSLMVLLTAPHDGDNEESP